MNIPLGKKLFFSAIYLALITSAHFSGLSLVSGNLWIKVFWKDLQILLLSALVLMVVYIVSFSAFLLSGKKRELRWPIVCFLFSLGVVCFSYVMLFPKGVFLQKVSVSVVLFSWIAIALVFFQTEATFLSKVMRYVLGIILFAISMTSIYKHQDLLEMLFYPKALIADQSVEKKFDKKESKIRTSFYNLSTIEYSISDYYIPAKLANIPSYLGVINDKNFLVIDRLGNMFHLYLKSNAKEKATFEKENLYRRMLAARFPINYREVNKFNKFNKFNKSYFRVHDLYIERENESGEQRSLYVSHSFWNAEKECFTVRITKMTQDISVLLESHATPTWRTLYESTPCFHRLSSGHQAGGRIVGMDEESLLFTIGDHGFDSTEDPGNFPQDIDTAYGKIWKINRTTGEADMISLGHRNPQGLYRAPNGTIWSTEHGPASGDELNKVNVGANYGWPHALYGTSYGAETLRGEVIQNDHGDYEHPVFAWVPAIAVSELIGVEGDLFPLWKDNLLVSSLKAQTLFRLQIHEDRVVYSEAIKIDKRIRDLAQTSNGELLLWTDDQSLVRLLHKEQPAISKGEQIFQEKCAACHNMWPDHAHGFGPNLHNVYASKIARHSDYNYSKALLARAQDSWTRKNLDLFLENSLRFASGTTMQQIEISADERQTLIQYMRNN